MSYKAEGSEHDDLVMALMLACFMARKHIGRKLGKVIIINAGRGYSPNNISQSDAFRKYDRLPYGDRVRVL